MTLFDITRPLGNTTAHFPGDTPYRLEPGWEIAKGATVNVSKITLSPHNGTHADAPYHYDEQGQRIDEIPLDRFIGPARVIHLTGLSAISKEALSQINLTGVTRLLIHTGSCPVHTHFHDHFTYLKPEAVEYLSAQGVQLIGVDTHSVDAADSKELPAHHACRRAGILIVENLDLAQVPPGDYELIALPLKLVGADASPIRAILRQG